MSAKELEPFWAVRNFDKRYARSTWNGAPEWGSTNPALARQFENLWAAHMVVCNYYRDHDPRHSDGDCWPVHVQPIPGKEQRRVISREDAIERKFKGVKVAVSEGDFWLGAEMSHSVEGALLFDDEQQVIKHLSVHEYTRFRYVLVTPGPTEYKVTPASEILASMVQTGGRGSVHPTLNQRLQARTLEYSTGTNVPETDRRDDE